IGPPAADPQSSNQHRRHDPTMPTQAAQTRDRSPQSDAGKTAADVQASVDVVIPVRDGALFIKACLDSVRAQTLQPSSVIVVDDGSTDDTPDIIERYAAHWPELWMIRTDPRGTSHARNI